MLRLVLKITIEINDAERKGLAMRLDNDIPKSCKSFVFMFYG